jgi:ER lumen protein retaining receptor
VVTAWHFSLASLDAHSPCHWTALIPPAGISLRTQELYLLVFVTRYLDLFYSYVSLYNSVMKVIYVSSSATIVYLMRQDPVVSQTYDAERDTFRVMFLVGPSMLLALLIHYSSRITEILWTFSIYLEAVSIFPQLVLMQRTLNIDNLTAKYVFLLGMYRGLYILNWIWRYFTEPGYRQWLVWTSGVVQTALYGDFFYYYLQAWNTNQRLHLPS